MADTICIIGNGYVGLPLAMAFSEKYETISYSPSVLHTEELRSGKDRTKSFSVDALKNSCIYFTSDIKEIRRANIYIITVPTPIDRKREPDLNPIKSATQTVSTVLNEGDIVVYESTVYIGCTEGLCVPILEKYSGLKFNQDFFCGFSPERINPADKEHTISMIKKVVSGSTPEVAKHLEQLYGSIISAGIYLAPTLKVAEGAKLIENVQRDLNIALMNQLSILCDKLKIDTNDILDAASTKWNFHRYTPGLVGGHCISVDPYYLIYNGEEVGMDISLVRTQREVNESMPRFISLKTIELLQEKGINPQRSRILIMGVAFKENCPDIRNSKVVDIYRYLEKKVGVINLYDPVVDTEEVQRIYSLNCYEREEELLESYDAIIVAVAHDVFLNMNIEKYFTANTVLYDLKGKLPRKISTSRL